MPDKQESDHDSGSDTSVESQGAEDRRRAKEEDISATTVSTSASAVDEIPPTTSPTSGETAFTSTPQAVEVGLSTSIPVDRVATPAFSEISGTSDTVDSKVTSIPASVEKTVKTAATSVEATETSVSAPVDAKVPPSATPVKAAVPSAVISVDAAVSPSTTPVDRAVPGAAIPVDAEGPPSTIPIGAAVAKTFDAASKTAATPVEAAVQSAAIPVEAEVPPSATPVDAAVPPAAIPVGAEVPRSVTPVDTTVPTAATPVDADVPSSATTVDAVAHPAAIPVEVAVHHGATPVEVTVQPAAIPVEAAAHPAATSVEAAVHPATIPVEAAVHPAAIPVEAVVQAAATAVEAAVQPAVTPVEAAVQPAAIPVEAAVQPAATPVEAAVLFASTPVETAVSSTATTTETVITSDLSPTETAIVPVAISVEATDTSTPSTVNDVATHVTTPVETVIADIPPTVENTDNSGTPATVSAEAKFTSDQTSIQNVVESSATTVETVDTSVPTTVETKPSDTNSVLVAGTPVAAQVASTEADVALSAPISSVETCVIASVSSTEPVIIASENNVVSDDVAKVEPQLSLMNEPSNQSGFSTAEDSHPVQLTTSERSSIKASSTQSVPVEDSLNRDDIPHVQTKGSESSSPFLLHRAIDEVADNLDVTSTSRSEPQPRSPTAMDAESSPSAVLTEKQKDVTETLVPTSVPNEYKLSSLSESSELAKNELPRETAQKGIDALRHHDVATVIAVATSSNDGEEVSKPEMETAATMTSNGASVTSETDKPEPEAEMKPVDQRLPQISHGLADGLPSGETSDISKSQKTEEKEEMMKPFQGKSPKSVDTCDRTSKPLDSPSDRRVENSEVGRPKKIELESSPLAEVRPSDQTPPSTTKEREPSTTAGRVPLRLSIVADDASLPVSRTPPVGELLPLSWYVDWFRWPWVFYPLMCAVLTLTALACDYDPAVAIIVASALSFISFFLLNVDTLK